MSGNKVSGRKQLASFVVKEFMSIFQSSNPGFPEDLEGLLKVEVTQAENDAVKRISDREEIRRVVWQLHPLKSPGPDGFSGCFYKKLWDIVGVTVVNFVQDLFRNKYFLKLINRTFITMIPKGESAGFLINSVL